MHYFGVLDPLKHRAPLPTPRFQHSFTCNPTRDLLHDLAAVGYALKVGSALV